MQQLHNSESTGGPVYFLADQSDVILSKMKFRENGLVILRNGNGIVSNIYALNLALKRNQSKNIGEDVSYLIARYALHAFYRPLPDTLKSEYPECREMILRFAREHISALLGCGGQIHYAAFQSWIHRYFYPN